ncbi:MAG: NTP transferase domain-containing protein [Sinobacteraceae bacterium]|nr:NTP transferase domain-containing protein [Nevskiaceae bacterium]
MSTTLTEEPSLHAVAAPPLFGLVLAGGRSARMQRDKATLAYHGTSQLEWAVQRLKPCVERVFVSVRPDQQQDSVRARFEQIVDTRSDLGPTAGIVAAQERFPHVAWLVLACDLPFLDDDSLSYLVRSRNPRRAATAFRSSHDGLPEPLCAIYEPASRPLLLQYVATGKSCPRKFLSGADTELLQQPQPRALDNVNTPDEYGAAVNALHSSDATRVESSDATRVEPSGDTRTQSGGEKRVHVQYFALLREQAGRSEETVVTSAGTPRALYDELRARYPFSLAAEMLRVAINSEFAEWSRSLQNGDSIVFIPPVAGG